MKIEKTKYADFEGYKLSTPDWETICIPELGANLPLFTHLATGRQWLWINPAVPTQKHEYGCPYGWGSADGIDECFPAIAEGRYPLDPYAGAFIPDHGDLWTLPWLAEVAPDMLRTVIHGPMLPYRMERTLSEAPDGGLLFSYRLTNTAAAPLSYIWSSHAVCAAEPGMLIDVEQGAEFRVYNSRGERFGPVGSTYKWGEGAAADISLIPPCDPSAMFSHKLFIEHVKRDWVALYDPRTDSHLRFAYDGRTIDTVGLWMQMCAAPDTDQIALEPCMGTYDGLDESLQAGTALTLAPGATRSWWWSLTPLSGKPTP